MVDLMRLERTTSSLQGTLSPIEIQTRINGWYSNPHFRATIHYTFGFAYNVAPPKNHGMFLDYIQRPLLSSEQGRYSFLL